MIGSGHGPILRRYPGIRLEGQKKTAKILIQDIQSLGPRIEPGTSEYEEGVLRHSATTFGNVINKS